MFVLSGATSDFRGAQTTLAPGASAGERGNLDASSSFGRKESPHSAQREEIVENKCES